MKKLLALLLALVMVFAFAACGGNTDVQTDGEGDATSYDNLGIAMELTSEEYGIGFRKGSDLTAEVNSLIAQLKEDGTLVALAEKYSLHFPMQRRRKQPKLQLRISTISRQTARWL